MLQADRNFVDALARIRSGSCSPSNLQDLTSQCSGPLDLSDGILPTVVRPDFLMVWLSPFACSICNRGEASRWGPCPQWQQAVIAILACKAPLLLFCKPRLMSCWPGTLMSNA